MHEVRAVVAAGVPGAGANAHLAEGAVPVQIIVNENRLDFRVATPDPVEQFPVTDMPEIALLTRVTEPASIIAVGSGEHQRRKLALLGALVDFLHEPTRVHAGELCARQLAVADHDDDFLILKAGDVRPVADFFPAHRLQRLDISAVHQHVTITESPERRNQLHAKAQLRRPEALKVRPPEQVPANAQPTSQVFFPICRRDEREHRMVITRAQRFKDTAILEMPEQVTTFDDAIHALLKRRGRKRLQERPRKAQMDPGYVLVFP